MLSYPWILSASADLDLISFVAENRILTTLSIIGSLFGVPLSLYTFLRSKREKSPVYARHSFTVTKDAMSRISGVEITYHGRKVPNLSVSHVLFMNVGRLAIRSADLVPKDPLRVQLPEGAEILDAKVLSQKNPANQFGITANGSKAEITFEYVGYGEGAVFQLFHTATSPRDVDLVGSIIDSNPVNLRSALSNDNIHSKKSKINIPKPVAKFLNLVGLLAVGSGGVIGIGIVLFTIGSFLRAPSWSEVVPHIFMTLIGGSLLLAPLILWKTRIPKGFAHLWEGLDEQWD